jgi:hypothetical protein
MRARPTVRNATDGVVGWATISLPSVLPSPLYGYSEVFDLKPTSGNRLLLFGSRSHLLQMRWKLSRCDNSAAFSGGTMGAEDLLGVITLRRCTRRYSSQRDEFHHHIL